MRRILCSCGSIVIVIGIVYLATPGAFAAPDGTRCLRVSGSFEEQAVTDACASPVGLCTASRYQGELSGDAAFTATSIVPSADTPATSVVFATGDTVLGNVRVAGRRGSLTIKDAAVFHAAGEGELLDIQTIVGGTDDLAGATGVIRAVGTFVDGAGRSTFDGYLCLP